MASSVKQSDKSAPLFGALDVHTAAALLAVGGDIALVIDSVGVIREVTFGESDAVFANDAKWVGRSWSDTVTMETRSKIETLVKEATVNGVSKRRQVNHVTPDGDDVPVAYTALRLGKDGALVAVGRDMRGVSALQQRLVEAQQAMERDYWKLRHVETRYRLLFQVASDGILVLDAATLKVLDANAAAGQLFGESAERLVGRTFPFGVGAVGARAIGNLLATARAAGRADDILVQLADSDREFHLSASCFRQESSTLMLVRVSTVESSDDVAGEGGSSRLQDLLDRSPDGFVITDLDGSVLTANRAFLDIAELTSEEQVRGLPLANWIGRPGADMGVFQSMLRKHGAVRLVATSARGAHGGHTEVEISGVWVPDGEEPCIGFTIRDIGRRLAGGVQGARDLTRAVEELTSLVGRVSLRDLVRDTIDLVERHFIEAALDLTNDNRTSAAEVLGVSRQSLYVKLRRHGLGAPPAADDMVS